MAKHTRYALLPRITCRSRRKLTRLARPIEALRVMTPAPHGI
jgi:hypothetical protein